MNVPRSGLWTGVAEYDTQPHHLGTSSIPQSVSVFIGVMHPSSPHLLGVTTALQGINASRPRHTICRRRAALVTMSQGSACPRRCRSPSSLHRNARLPASAVSKPVVLCHSATVACPRCDTITTITTPPRPLLTSCHRYRIAIGTRPQCCLR